MAALVRTRATRQRALLCGAALALAGGTSFALATPASPDAAFTLSASAQGVATEITNSSIPLITSVQLNTPTAQATLNSRGQATSYSAAPDPGQDVAELPATGSAELCAILAGYGAKVPGCSSIAPLIPAYPYAYAQTGDAPQDKSFAGAHLHAEARENASEGQTIFGASGVTSGTSTARTSTTADGSEDATADASVDAFQLTAAVKVSGIHASASIHRDSAGKLTTTSSFDIGHLTISGLDIGYDDGTFVVLGTQVPVPIPLQTVLSALKPLGVTATFLPPIKTDTGITSEGLSLSYAAPGAPSGLLPPIPVPLPIGVGVPTTPTVVTFTLGRAAVDGSYHSIPGSDSTGLIGGPTTPPSVAPSAAPATSGSSSAPATTTDPGVIDPGTPLTTEPSLDPGSAPAVAPPTGSSAPTLVAASPRAAVKSDATDIYLAFVVIALAVFCSATAIRFLGVRLSWTS